MNIPKNHNNKTSIAVLAGDGIGPEVMQQTLRVLNHLAPEITIKEALIGGAAYQKYQHHCPPESLETCLSSNAVLFGSVGGPVDQAHLPQWHGCEKNSILALRQALGLCINLRPTRFYPALKDISPLKSHLLDGCEDILIFRELLGDIYFGEHKHYQSAGIRCATDSAQYNENQIKIIAHQAFKVALNRKKTLTSVDKANVLSTSKLWRTVFNEVAQDYPDVQLQHMLVDNCAMQLILNPGQFDVIATANLFGDILSDAASALPGSLGMMPSASFSAVQSFALYEPSGGSAPDIAGKDIANPMAQIMSLALLFRYSLDRETQARQIEQAIESTLEKGFRTADIMQSSQDENTYTQVGTSAFTDQVLAQLAK